MTERTVSTTVVWLEGKMRIEHRDAFMAQCAEAFVDGQELTLTLEEPEARRTRAQEKFFHGPVLKAFMSLGQHKEDAKADLCLLFIPKEVHRSDGSTVLVPGSTSKLSKKEYTDFIEACIEQAARLDLYIEDVDEWRESQRVASKKGKAA